MVKDSINNEVGVYAIAYVDTKSGSITIKIGMAKHCLIQIGEQGHSYAVQLKKGFGNPWNPRRLSGADAPGYEVSPLSVLHRFLCFQCWKLSCWPCIVACLQLAIAM